MKRGQCVIKFSFVWLVDKHIDDVESNAKLSGLNVCVVHNADMPSQVQRWCRVANLTKSATEPSYARTCVCLQCKLWQLSGFTSHSFTTLELDGMSVTTVSHGPSVTLNDGQFNRLDVATA